MKINKILFYGILVIGIFFLFLGKMFFFLLFIACFLFVFGISKIIDRIQINKKYKLIIYSAVWLHLIGEIYFYHNFKYYDNLLHFFVPIFVTLMVFDYLKKYKIKDFRFCVFFIVLGMLCLFEIFEYFIDSLFNLNMLGVFNKEGIIVVSSINDTMEDLISGFLGSLSFLILNYKKNGT